jgi:hypothetical protein
MFRNHYIVRTYVQTSLLNITCPLKLALSFNNGDDFLPEMVVNRFIQHIKISSPQRPEAAQSRKWQTMVPMTRIGS